MILLIIIGIWVIVSLAILIILVKKVVSGIQKCVLQIVIIIICIICLGTVIITLKANPTQLIEKGNEAQKYANYAEAEVNWQQVLKNDPNDVVARRNLGISLSEQKKLDEGLKEFDQVIQLKPNSAEAYFSKGLKLYYQQKPKELEQAIANFRETIKNDPNNNDMAHYYLGNALSDQNKLDEAIKEYEKAINIDRNYSRAYNNKGVALQKKKNFKDAITAYEKAINFDENYKLAKQNLIWAKKEQELAQRYKLSSLKRSVVKIEVQNSGGYSQGTGWVVRRKSNSALIVTNRHVLRGSTKSSHSELNEKIQVQFYSKNDSDRRLWHDAKIYKITTENKLDLALLKVAGIADDIQSLPMSSTNVDQTQKVKIIGHPSIAGIDSGWSIVSGEISNIESETIQISTSSLSPGHSGSPVLNEDDQVVGVLTFIKALDPSVKTSTIGGFGEAYQIKFVKDQLRDWGISIN